MSIVSTNSGLATDIIQKIEDILVGIGLKLEDLSEIDQIDWGDDALVQLLFTGFGFEDVTGQSKNLAELTFNIKVGFLKNTAGESRDQQLYWKEQLRANLTLPNINDTDKLVRVVLHPSLGSEQIEYDGSYSVVNYALVTRYADETVTC